jgi:hypothetical protein
MNPAHSFLFAVLAPLRDHSSIREIRVIRGSFFFSEEDETADGRG